MIHNLQPYKIQIYTQSFLKNLQTIHTCIQNKRLDWGVILKGNAYGHGLDIMTKLYNDLPDNIRPKFYILFKAENVLKIAEFNPKTSILLIGPIDKLQIKELIPTIKQNNLDLHVGIWSLEQLQELAEFKDFIKFHIFVDTGMHREGILLQDLPKALEYSKQNNIAIIGLFSHFAYADNVLDPSYTKFQEQNYKKALEVFADYKMPVRYRHISASSGLFSAKLKENNYNLVRLGIISYGIDSFFGFIKHSPAKKLHLQPYLGLYSKIVQVKEIGKNAFVGYSKLHKTTRKTRIGLLPIGYYDGVPMGLSNKGFVKVAGKYVKIIGRVSMNITIIDITDIPEAKMGSEVEIISPNTKDKNSVLNIAKLAGISPYQVLVGLKEEIRREIV